MPITKLEIHDLGPFDEIVFDLDERVNVFTGSNNTGKSTVLMLLAELLVYPFGIPEKLFRKPRPEWKLTYSTPDGETTRDGLLPSNVQSMLGIFSDVGYTCYVPALRASTNFRSNGPSVGPNTDEQLELYTQRLIRDFPSVGRVVGPDLLRTRLREQRHGEDPELARRFRLLHTDPSLIYDRDIMQRLIDLDYAAFRRQEPTITETIERIALVVSKITAGYSLTYLGIEEDDDGLFPQFQTPDGKLPLDVLSQGTQSLIQCLSCILLGYGEFYNFSPDYLEKPGVVIIDEIDAHLHPSWQQGILSALTDNFPELQFFCSTHSPLTLAGLNAGQIQLLRRNEAGDHVDVTTNENNVSGWTADEILRTLLGVRNPTDLATAKNVVRLQELRRQGELSPLETAELEDLRRAIHRQLSDGANST